MALRTGLGELARRLAGDLRTRLSRRRLLRALAALIVTPFLLIGVMLVAEGMGSHMEKGYIYVAMAFSLFVELLNLRYRTTRRAPGRPGGH